MSEVFIVLTEEYYGNPEYIKVFSTESAANTYKEELTAKFKLAVDVLVIKSKVDN